MDRCDVLIVGAGPAGSTCARGLRQAGLDPLILDAALFPRDKLCAGWMTAQAVRDAAIDVDEYRGSGRTIQPITGFDVGVIDASPLCRVRYASPVSYAVRRRELDEYLLISSGARHRLGDAVRTIRRSGDRWSVNESYEAPMLVGAGGHFCPVARLLNGSARESTLITAREIEGRCRLARSPMEPGIVGLYFQPDLTGYGWCFWKGDSLTLGYGHIGTHRTPEATREFVTFLERRYGVVLSVDGRWRGHAYLASLRPQIADTAALLIGDAAGVAAPRSGEGIGPAIETGLIAAETIAATKGTYERARLAPYERRVRARFGRTLPSRIAASCVPPSLATRLAGPLLKRQWFVRHVLLDRWFLHAGAGLQSRGAGLQPYDPPISRSLERTTP